MLDDRLQRARLSLLGLSLGDALGSQFFVPGNRHHLASRSIPPAPWQWTDDTEMAGSVYLVRAAHNGIEQDALAASFARRHDFDRGYGPATGRMLRLVREGGDWRTLAAGLFGGSGSWGNGAAPTTPSPSPSGPPPATSPTLSRPSGSPQRLAVTSTPPAPSSAASPPRASNSVACPRGGCKQPNPSQDGSTPHDNAPNTVPGMDLTGSVALVTGANRALGAHLVAELLRVRRPANRAAALGLPGEAPSVQNYQNKRLAAAEEILTRWPGYDLGTGCK